MQAGETPAPSVAAGGELLKVTAANIKFDTHELTVGAGEPFQIEFTNQDTLPHNIGIYQGAKEVFRGDVQNGAGTVTYSVPALEAGDYTFICDYHPVPDMTGTLTVK